MIILYKGPPSVVLRQLLFKTFFFVPILFYVTAANEQFSACKPFSCGNVISLSFPFWVDSLPAYCGHPKFKLHCDGDNVTININSQTFRVIHVNSAARTLTIARMDLWGTKCSNQFTNITLDYSFFDYTPNDEKSTLLYGCHPSSNATLNSSTAVRFDCPLHGIPREAYFLWTNNWTRTGLGCRTSITVPVLGVALRSFIDPGDVIDQGFGVKWELKGGWCDDCRISGGRCGYNVSLDEFTCFCPDGVCFADRLEEEAAPAPWPEPRPSRSSGSSTEGMCSFSHSF
ncbi:LEAF RUST 10 DISEASE-RESISTANCE LOCUS RECEPTOR-LIKE PROTEIN KINASE-like 2.7 [Neltuma alba]|uniref:LEAF RUST 10 DISEASE-RESISTANCE LOCUS RECEPTOR-LIKE PROTEIN KINASE-like 2.7 n=1 Tax=Neltuma alba TaxID=207710 RepID=UPI0010A54988|nr:LEAF RUST 10 DISEASE-RESISTANCE LOCUS RECEPTOR-LIKE PROTEIN KINASE-like 2.7 [Prosopis alba]